MNERGQYGRSNGHSNGRSYGHAHVGLKLFHTPDDSDQAVRQIDTEINAIVDSMYRAMGVDPSTLRKKVELKSLKEMSEAEQKDYMAQVNAHKERVLAAKAKAVQSPLWSFWDAAVSPIYDDWMEFRRSDKYFTYFRSWEEYEKWLERVRQLRTLVKGKGVRIETPDPVDLTKTLPGAIIDKAGDAAVEFGKIAKWGLIGALAIGGVVALTSVTSHLRKGSDPLPRYTDFTRRTA